LLFLDLETTGLAGGAGTYAFLVGCGWFDGATFRLRQFFLSNFGAERALLESVAELAAGTACVVTYNGKSFDLPLMETRFVLQRMPTPFADMPHVDMLHPARRLWREDDVECRLTNLERTLCGREREGDVPGSRSITLLSLRAKRRCAFPRRRARAQPSRHHLAGDVHCARLATARGRSRGGVDGA
jgi:uncharacterized protein YprB with RNaseH-like and TPR domain